MSAPVREQEGTDVRHRRGRRPELCQRHDVFESDVGLSAYIHHMDFLREAMGAAAGGPPDDLHHDGVPGSAEGLHRLLMARFGQLLPVHLKKTETNYTWVIFYLQYTTALYTLFLYLLTVAIETSL